MDHYRLTVNAYSKSSSGQRHFHHLTGFQHRLVPHLTNALVNVTADSLFKIIALLIVYRT